MKQEFEYKRLNLGLHKSEYAISHLQQNIELVAYSTIAFIAPFMFAHSQLLVGSIVNAALVLCALNLRGAKLLPIILFPSIGAVAAGALFGSFTWALVYMVPFIWVANAILVLAIKRLVLNEGKNRMLSLGIGASLKAGFLFACAGALLALGFVPAAFLGAMGMMQLASALCGGTVAFALQAAKKRLNLIA